jgi:putative endonuclease
VVFVSFEHSPRLSTLRECPLFRGKVKHQEGCGANHTAKRLPVRLVYYEFFEHVADAFYREKQVQGWSRKKKEALMAGETNLLHGLAECQNETHYGFASGGFGSAQPPGD